VGLSISSIRVANASSSLSSLQSAMDDFVESVDEGLDLVGIDVGF